MDLNTLTLDNDNVFIECLWFSSTVLNMILISFFP